MGLKSCVNKGTLFWPCIWPNKVSKNKLSQIKQLRFLRLFMLIVGKMWQELPSVSLLWLWFRCWCRIMLSTAGAVCIPTTWPHHHQDRQSELHLDPVCRCATTATCVTPDRNRANINTPYVHSEVENNFTVPRPALKSYKVVDHLMYKPFFSFKSA